jgi:PAS domain S-box-containing protein
MLKRISRYTRGLAARLALASVALTGILLLAYGWMASQLAEDTLKNELGAKLGSVARLAAADEKVRQLPFAIIREGRVIAAARPRLASIAAGMGIGNLIVVDRDMRVLVDARGRYRFHDPGWQLRLDAAELNRVWKGEVASSPVYLGEDGGLYLSAYAPVTAGGEVKLAVAAEASADFLRNVRKLRARFTGVGLIVLALAAVLGVLMAQTVTMPLRQLHSAVERVGRGDFTAIAEVHAGHEVGDLARAFNRMTQSINVRHEQILESMSDGLVAVDRAGNVAEMNRAAESLLGMKRDAALGRDFRGSLPPELASALEDSLAGNEPLRGEKIPVPGTAGIRILRVSTSPISDADGTSKGAEISFLDVTEMEKLTTAFEAQRRFAAIGEMAAEVAHQIRNPLAAIQGFADLMKTELTGSGKGTEFLEDLLKEVRTTEGIVGNFLLFARPARLVLAPCRIDETVGGVCRAFEPEFERAGVRIGWTAEGTVPVVRADAKLVEQAVANLLRNALEASSRGGSVRVTVSAADTPDQVSVSVEDAGAGLAMDIRNKLFTPFVTTKAQGTGLGLSLAKKFVEAHGGTISLTPLTRGTRAMIRLPVEPIADEV